MNQLNQDIIDLLPYKSTFRFVDHLSVINEQEVRGDYRVTGDEFFFRDHFVDNPVTPGVIITEIMAQIGVVTMGIYLGMQHSPATTTANVFPLFTSSEVSFYKMVKPPQVVTVYSKKIYYRLGKLKCEVEIRDEADDLVARGFFAGVLKIKTDEV